MCEDQVASVRDTAASQCYLIARSLASDSVQINAFMDKVLAFKRSKKYSMRQTFIVMCESVIAGDLKDSSVQRRVEAERIFYDNFLTGFTELQSDRIVNVRIHAS